MNLFANILSLRDSFIRISDIMVILFAAIYRTRLRIFPIILFFLIFFSYLDWKTEITASVYAKIISRITNISAEKNYYNAVACV